MAKGFCILAVHTHLPEAPEILFYYFTCALEKYCLNREAAYFKNTMFYHYIFHGYSHKVLPFIYSCKDLFGYKGINPSFCECVTDYSVLRAY